MPEEKSVVHHIRRRRIDDSLETKIVTGIIVSTRFIRGVQPMLDVECFSVPFAKRVVKWSLDYYERYHEAPGSHIEDIFNSERRQLEPSEVNIIQDYLATLSESYSEERYNPAYWLDKAEGFFKEQSLRLIKNNIDALLGAGRVEDAEQELLGYKQIMKATSGWIDPFDQAFVEESMSNHEEGRLFKMPGAAGDLMGWFREGHLVGFEAPMKRGKSFYLTEVFACALSNGIPTVFIGLGDMSEYEYAQRLYKRFTAMGDFTGDFLYPVLDCFHNQDGTCLLPRRTNRHTLLEPTGKKPKWSSELPYRPCTVCRGTRQFHPESWFEIIRRPKLTTARAKASVRGLSIQFGRNLARMRCYPADTANMKRINNDLMILQYTEGFVPRMIITDYLDLAAPEEKGLVGIEKDDATWKAGKWLAEVWHACHVSATQTGRQSINKHTVQAGDTAGYIGKLRHVNKMWSLNQTKKDKFRGILRVGTLVDRDKFFTEDDHVMVLQQLSTGQPMLDSVRVGFNWDNDIDEEGT